MTTSKCNIAGITLVSESYGMDGLTKRIMQRCGQFIQDLSGLTNHASIIYLDIGPVFSRNEEERERERERANPGCDGFENKIGVVGKAAGRFTHWLVGRREVGNAQYHLVCILGTSCCCWGLACSALQKIYPGTL
jgi:hypothetical protein